MLVIVDTKPLNRAAEYGMLGIVDSSPEHATLTDGDGSVYDVAFMSTEFDPFNQALTGQSLMFERYRAQELLVRGHIDAEYPRPGNIVGPFVFESAQVVSETAPAEMPQVPGGPGGGESTTTPVSVNG